MEAQKFERLTTEEVHEIIQMAEQIYRNAGYYSPFLSNQNLIGINNNPLSPTKDKLNKALSDAPYNTELLRAFSEYSEVRDALYSRTIDYYATMLNFDLHITCRNAKPEDYDTQEYKDDLNRVYKFLDKFNYKQHFQAMLKEVVRTGVFYGWFRNSMSSTKDMNNIDDVENGIKNSNVYTIQEMPHQFCLITGQDENTYLYDFDMTYFLRPGVSLGSFDPVFRKYYKETFNSKVDDLDYNPNAPLNKRDGVYAQYHQTSPEDGAICMVWDYSNATGISPFIPLIKDILTDEQMDKLQTDVNMLAAKGILYGSIGVMTKAKSGEVADQMEFSPKTLTKFLSLVKAGLGDSIAVAAMPTKETKFVQFDNNYTKAIYADQLSTTAGNAASASRIIYSSDKTSQFELQIQVETDYHRVSRLYQQFNNILNLYVNKKTKKFKFNFNLSGSTYNFIRDKENQALLDLANVGMVLNSSAYAKIVGMQPNEFIRAMAEGHHGDFTKNLTQLISIHNSSQNPGRPQADAADLSDSGEANHNM